MVSGMPLLSVIVPVYNEEKTIAKIIGLIDSLKIDKEIIVVDDASCDKSREILDGLNLPCLRIISHRRNMGKGAAFRTGLNNARGEIVIIQDADLEYAPRDYLKLIPPILSSQTKRWPQGATAMLSHISMTAMSVGWEKSSRRPPVSPACPSRGLGT